MRVSKEDGVIWYEGNDRKAMVSQNSSGYMVHSQWTRDGKNWFGGYGEGRNGISLDEATDLAKRFVNGLPVPEGLGGYEDNKPVEAT